MLNKFRTKRNLINIIIIIILLLYICRFSTIFDEIYSIALSNNNFLKIIQLDSLDVHPPLFYFLLKVFLQFTTFWTSSILIKVLFARILMVIISLITFVFLIKILKNLHIYNSIFLQWISFLLIPGVISLTYEFIKIRMYSLGAMFIVIEFYELVNCNNKFLNKKLFIIAIMFLCAIYTNYYAGFVAGLIVFVYMISALLKHKKYWVNIFLSGLIVVVLFIPWIFILIKQLSLKSQHVQGSFMSQWVISLMLILLFIYPLIWAHKNLNALFYKFFLFSFFILLCLFMLMTLISMISHQSVFEFRYLYPIFLIYGYFGINTLFIIIKKKHANYIDICGMLIILIICLIGSFGHQIYYYNISSNSIHIIRQFDQLKSAKNYVFLREPNNLYQGIDIEKAMYLSKLHKKFNASKNIRFIIIHNRLLFHNENKYIEK